ncbi:endothelin-converting enzyme homolog isoform X2 [Cloeon dipterum]|uniref:endothelin-converting enzyme homolog isoform X2 n=1 Tax=Cloeon dipterum TaxID=197152 RepID=UPI00321FAD74
MPRKGAYHIANSSPEEGLSIRQHKDYSYPACLASMLAFLAICLIIIACTFPWKYMKEEHTNDGSEFDKFEGNRFPSPKTTDPDFHGRSDDDTHKRHKSKSTVPPQLETVQPTVTATDVDEKTTTLSHQSSVVPTTSTEKPVDDYVDVAEEGSAKISKNEEIADAVSEATTLGAETTTEEIKSSSSSVADKTEATISSVIVTEPTVEPKEQVQTSKHSSVSASTTSSTILSASAVSSASTEPTSKMQDDQTSNSDHDSRCPSQLCSTIASRQLSLMNVDANPCDDFYEYACGSLRISRNLAEPNPDAQVNEKLRMAIKKVDMQNSSVPLKHRFFKSFYQDCLDYENDFNYNKRLNKAKTILQSVGTFLESGHADSMTLTDLVAKMLQYNSAPLFDILLDVSEAGRDAPFSIKVVPPLPRNSFFYPNSHFNGGHCFADTAPPEDENVKTDTLYEKYAECKNNEGSYIDSVGKALREFGAFSDDQGKAAEWVTATKVGVEELLRSKILTSAQYTEANIRIDAVSKGYEMFTINELQNQYSMLNWTALLTKVVAANNSTLINDKIAIQVYSKSYITELFNQLDINSGETALYNAILAMFWHMLYTDFVVAKGNCDRPNFCTFAAQRFMDDAASSLYLSEFDSAAMTTIHAQVREMFDKETTLLATRIRHSPQIKDETEKDKLIEKLENMRIEISGNRKQTAEIYIVEKDLEEDYFSKAIRLLKRRRQRMYSDYRGRKPDKPSQIWSHFSLPTLTNANAVYGLNAVLVPQGLIANKYIQGAPEYINMGILGTIIAHEIIHHFDSTGIDYNADGKRSTAVTTQNENIFQDLTTQLEQQFSFQKSYNLGNGRFADFNIHSELSQNERFADIAAIDVAYEVIKKGLEHESEDESYMNLPYVNYNQSKSFFLAHAQMFCTKKEFLDFRVKLYEGEHLPPQIRVDMIMRNSRYFLKTFACPPRKTQSFQDILQIDD